MANLFAWLLVATLLLVDGLQDFEGGKVGAAKTNSNNRNLESNDGDFESYLVDRNGVEYDPYSLAWRYLGMFIDCDVDAQQSQQEEEGDGRFLEGDDDDDSDSCERKLLWAAYVDPRYQGGSIGEYQFYDLDTGEWDKSTCQTRRCAKMDCHEAGTHFKLVGVFKETEGLYDWAEQLFKHEGYCVWNDEDKYDLMQEHLTDWPTYCIQMTYPDADGNTIYWHTLPQADGNLTHGIFTDSSCTQVSTTTNFTDYVVIYYYNYYGSNDYGEEQAESWAYNIEKWNEYMDTYKICQPCRAYSLSQNEQQDGDRFLENDENDGEGDEEQWGYNCYDDAGYTNCNQCYKFQTKTSLQPASKQDLVRASKQGSILRIKVNGRVYGSGGIGNTGGSSALKLVALVLGLGMLVGGLALFVVRRRYLKEKLTKALPASFRESLQDDAIITTKSAATNSSGRKETQGGGGIFILFTIMSRWFQKKLTCSPCSSCPCSSCLEGSDKNVDDATDDGSDDVRELPAID